IRRRLRGFRGTVAIDLALCLSHHGASVTLDAVRGKGGFMKKALLVTAVLAALVAIIPAAASSIPSGQRMLGQNVLEPVYNDENAGVLGYIMQPEHVAQPVNSNPTAWAPFYLVIYPVGSTAATTYLCMHLPVDN